MLFRSNRARSRQRKNQLRKSNYLEHPERDSLHPRDRWITRHRCYFCDALPLGIQMDTWRFFGRRSLLCDLWICHNSVAFRFHSKIRRIRSKRFLHRQNQTSFATPIFHVDFNNYFCWSLRTRFNKAIINRFTIRSYWTDELVVSLQTSRLF